MPYLSDNVQSDWLKGRIQITAMILLQIIFIVSSGMEVINEPVVPIE